MDEAWERAVETALEGQGNLASEPRNLTLDGVVKCLQGRLPAPGILERFQSLQHLSIANIGVSTLEKFPRLRNLQRLILSDNRIAGGLEHLVEAGLDSLRDLDLSNNRIQYLEDLAPLAQLRLVSLDLYECPVTRVKDYRSRVFGMMRSLKYLDKMDADENERPETEDEEDEEEDEEDDEDPGSGEVDGEDRIEKGVNGFRGSRSSDAIVDMDEDEGSDADEEEIEMGGARQANGSDRASRNHLSNGFRVAVAGAVQGEEVEEEVEEDVEDDEEDDLVDEIDDEEGDDEDVVEVHEVEDSGEEDGVEEVRDGDDGGEVGEEEDYEEEEDVEDEGGDDEEPPSIGRLTSTEGEIDGHEQGEEDENGEIGEDDEEAVDEERDYDDDDDDGEDEEDFGSEYMVQPIRQPVHVASVGGEVDVEEEDSEEEEVDDEEEGNASRAAASHPSSSSQASKRKRDYGDDIDNDSVEDSRSSKHR